MKKISIYLVSIIVIMIASCKNWVDDFTVSPNNPTQITPDLLLSVSELATFATYNGQLARTSSIFMQQSAGTDFQMLEVAGYAIGEDDNINEWKTIYADGLINMQTLIDSAGSENPWYQGIAKVLKCMMIGIATDYWGDIPYSQALLGLQGTENWNPEYDNQESIIATIQSDLDAAISDLSQPASANAKFPGGDDFIHNGDNTAWIKTAQILKMRYANRLSKKDATGSAQAALDVFNSSSLADGDDTYAIYGVNGNELNQWYSFNVTRANYIKMGKFFIDLLTSLSDPRLPLYAGLDDNGGYSGTAPEDDDVSTSNLGPLYNTDAAPLPLVTYSEALFIKAEAHFRLGQMTEAADAYNSAVKASILRTTGAPDPVYEAANANETSATITLDKIMTQKYIDMFTQPEVWADWRRTNIPALVPNQNALLGGIPRRLVTCIDERVNNSNAIVVSDMLAPVWWDQ